MRIKILLYTFIGFLVLAVTATGVFYKTSGSSFESMTMHGEIATFHGTGLYQFDPDPIAQEGIIWDAINLFIGLPFFVIAIYLTSRHSLRGKLLLGGFLCYFFYVYLMYATMMAFNRLFLIYVAIFSLSLVASLLNLRDIDVPSLPSHISARFPRRFFSIFAILLAAVLIILWSKLILSAMIPNQLPAEFAGRNTLQSQALDLGLIVPLALAAGILLWRRSSWGYLLTGISLTHGAMMFIAIPMWIVVPLIREGKINLIEAIPFLILCLVGLALAWMFYRSVQEEKVSG